MMHSSTENKELNKKDNKLKTAYKNNLISLIIK